MSEIVEDTLEERTPTEEELDDFKNKMAEWLKMDEQINKLSIAMRERRKLQNALSVILKTLCSNLIIMMFLLIMLKLKQDNVHL